MVARATFALEQAADKRNDKLGSARPICGQWRGKGDSDEAPYIAMTEPTHAQEGPQDQLFNVVQPRIDDLWNQWRSFVLFQGSFAEAAMVSRLTLDVGLNLQTGGHASARDGSARQRYDG